MTISDDEGQTPLTLEPKGSCQEDNPEALIARLREYAVETLTQLEHVRSIYQGLLREAEEIHEQNEKAFGDIRQIRHRLIGVRTLAELQRVLVNDLIALGVDQVNFILATDLPGSDWTDRNRPHPDVGGPWPLMDRKILMDVFLSLGGISVHMGPKNLLDKLGLWGPEIMSGVLAPLEYQGRLIGCLCLGAKTAERFTSERSPDLLDDLARTAAICVDNVLTHERNEQLATTDPLTGAYNRRAFYDHARRTMDLANRFGDTVACIYMDLNDFKPINDKYGHEVGDMALIKFTRYIQDRIRRTDILARLGGDEFAILLPRVQFDQALRLTENLRQNQSELSLAAEGFPEITLSASYGVAATRPNSCSFEDLLTQADTAMYQDKGKGPRIKREEIQNPKNGL